MKNGIIAAGLLALAFAGAARAADLAVGDAWARATPPGAGVAAAYLTIDNTGAEADLLLGASCERAERTEIHETRLEDGMMRMRRVEPLDVAAGTRVVLGPGGLHVMLMGLKAPLQAGERLPLTLRFERAGELRIEAEVLAGDATGPHAGHHH